MHIYPDMPARNADNAIGYNYAIVELNGQISPLQQSLQFLNYPAYAEEGSEQNTLFRIHSKLVPWIVLTRSLLGIITETGH